MTSIYFDHAATAPMSAEALAAYVEAASGGSGNPSSVHSHGRAARARVTAARDNMANLLGCEASELVYTAGGTESDNMALFGAAFAGLKTGRNGIVTSAVEHHAVLKTCKQLENQGFRLTVLPVNERGSVDLAAAKAAIDDNTAIVSVMAGNNETGTLQPIAEIGDLARSHKALMHVDAVQAFGYVPCDLRNSPIDLMSFSAHKINGPQGVGLLYVRKGTPFQPTLFGGSQERSRRAGTENVAGIAAFAKAAEIAVRHMETRARHATNIRDALFDSLRELLGEEAVLLNGDPDNRLPHILNVSFPGVPAETMLMNLDLAGVAASSGSACASGSLQPSHVLTAMNFSRERLTSAVRFSFGLGNTTEDAEKTAKIIATIWARLRIR